VTKLLAILASSVLGCLLSIGCAPSTRSTEPRLTFRELRSTRGGTWAAFELANPKAQPIWIEGFGPDEPLERWEQKRDDGKWVDAPGPISATGAEPQLIPPSTTVWIKKRVFPEDEEMVLRLGIREMREGGGIFSNGNDMIWSTPMRLPATRPAP
jgi:hypothetical protein